MLEQKIFTIQNQRGSYRSEKPYWQNWDTPEQIEAQLALLGQLDEQSHLEESEEDST